METKTTTYRNSFYNPRNLGSKEFISTDSEPLEYKGYLIYERIPYSCYDVVLNDICVHMFAGINGAKRFIDSI